MGDFLASGELEGEGEKEMRRGDKDVGEERMGVSERPPAAFPSRSASGTTWEPCKNGGFLRQKQRNTKPVPRLKHFYCQPEDGVKGRDTVEQFLKTLRITGVRTTSWSRPLMVCLGM